MAAVQHIAAQEGLAVLGWREVPHDRNFCGNEARAVLPRLVQLVVSGLAGESGMALDRKAYCLSKRAERETGLYLASLGSATIVYKGMLTALQLEPFFADLSDPLYVSAIALVHARFSTNTFPSWPLAHPYRLIAHNGEINTIRGNRNWMRAREAQLSADALGRDTAGRGIERLLPIMPDSMTTAAVSDSASFDACLELLHLNGRSLPHAVLMMIPEPWENNFAMDPARRDFYRFHASLMEPWDGPALIAFTDGTVVGAVLDRNGLRPGRYWITDDGLVVLASEVGVLDIEPDRVVRKGRLQPGRIFLADTAAGRIIEDEEVESQLVAELPYGDWLHAGMIHLRNLPERTRELPDSRVLLVQQQLFGYSEEDLRVLLAPMARTGAEPLGSIGDRPRLSRVARRQCVPSARAAPAGLPRSSRTTAAAPAGPGYRQFPGALRQVTQVDNARAQPVAVRVFGSQLRLPPPSSMIRPAAVSARKIGPAAACPCALPGPARCRALRLGWPARPGRHGLSSTGRAVARVVQHRAITVPSVNAITLACPTAPSADETGRSHAGPGPWRSCSPTAPGSYHTACGSDLPFRCSSPRQRQS